MPHLRGGLFLGLAVVFQFDLRVKLLFWFICQSSLNANWEEKPIWISYNGERVNSVTGERGNWRERRLIVDLSLTLFRCGFAGSDVSVNGLEVTFPERSTFLTIIVQATQSVWTIPTSILQEFCCHADLFAQYAPFIIIWDASHLPWVNISQILISISVSWNIHLL